MSEFDILLSLFSIVLLQTDLGIFTTVWHALFSGMLNEIFLLSIILCCDSIS